MKCFLYLGVLLSVEDIGGNKLKKNYCLRGIYILVKVVVNR